MSVWMRKGMGGVMMDEKGDQRCQDGLERGSEVSRWMGKGIGGVRMDMKGYGRCQVG